MPHLLTAFICLVLAVLLENAECHSLTQARAMLRSSGFFIGLAAALVGVACFGSF